MRSSAETFVIFYLFFWSTGAEKHRFYGNTTGEKNAERWITNHIMETPRCMFKNKLCRNKKHVSACSLLSGKLLRSPGNRHRRATRLCVTFELIAFQEKRSDAAEQMESFPDMKCWNSKRWCFYCFFVFCFFLPRPVNVPVIAVSMTRLARRCLKRRMRATGTECTHQTIFPNLHIQISISYSLRTYIWNLDQLFYCVARRRCFIHARSS